MRPEHRRQSLLCVPLSLQTERLKREGHHHVRVPVDVLVLLIPTAPCPSGRPLPWAGMGSSVAAPGSVKKAAAQYGAVLFREAKSRLTAGPCLKSGRPLLSCSRTHSERVGSSRSGCEAMRVVRLASEEEREARERAAERGESIGHREQVEGGRARAADWTAHVRVGTYETLTSEMSRWASSSSIAWSRSKSSLGLRDWSEKDAPPASRSGVPVERRV